jgi:hypothetical protein
MAKKELTNKDRLKLLEERKEKGEISDGTYKQLKAELEGKEATATPPSASIPTAAPEPSGPPPSPRKLPIIPIVAVAIVIIIIIAVAASGILGGGDDSKKSEGEEEFYEEPMSWEDVVTITGSISGGGPGPYGPDERVPFDVENTVVKMEITLTWNPQSQDLDLAIEDPEGRNRGASGNEPGVPESITIKKNIQAGTWTAVIDPFAAFGVDYTLEIIYSHETGNETGEGVLYQKTKSYSGESGEETDSFEVGDEYESLIIQVTISSAEGSMTLKIENPDGDVVYEKDVSGTEEVVDDKTVDAVSGEWKVDYSFDAFTGDIVIQVMGS